MLTGKIALPDSCHPIIIRKNPDFGHFISLDGMNSVLSINKYKKYVVFIFGSGFWQKNLAITRQIMALPDSGASAPPGTKGSDAYEYLECFTPLSPVMLYVAGHVKIVSCLLCAA